MRRGLLEDIWEMEAPGDALLHMLARIEAFHPYTCGFGIGENV